MRFTQRREAGRGVFAALLGVALAVAVAGCHKAAPMEPPPIPEVAVAQAALDQALGDLAQRQADNKKNQQDLARYKPLLAAQVISREDYDHVNQSSHASAAAVQAAQAEVETARLNFEWTKVISPIDGVAGIAKGQVGDLVSPTTLLTTVSQLDPIKVTFPISEREYLHFATRIKEHQEKGVAKGEPALEMILADGTIHRAKAHRAKGPWST